MSNDVSQKNIDNLVLEIDSKQLDLVLSMPEIERELMLFALYLMAENGVVEQEEFSACYEDWMITIPTAMLLLKRAVESEIKEKGYFGERQRIKSTQEFEGAIIESFASKDTRVIFSFLSLLVSILADYVVEEESNALMADKFNMEVESNQRAEQE